MDMCIVINRLRRYNSYTSFLLGRIYSWVKERMNMGSGNSSQTPVPYSTHITRIPSVSTNKENSRS
jgi:hypothetical protein